MQREQRVRAWTAVAGAHGLALAADGDDLALRGTLLGREVTIDEGNFFTYGLDVENALHVDVEEGGVTLAICAWDAGAGWGERRAGAGAPVPAAGRQVRANAAGVLLLQRLDEEERALLAAHPELDVFVARGRITIRLPYRLEPEHVGVAIWIADALASAASGAP